MLHLVERPAIVRPVYHFVKTQTTTYCAYLLGQAQYVGSILSWAAGHWLPATGLMLLELAAALPAQQLSCELGRLVGEGLREDVVALGQRLSGLLTETLCLLVLLATSDGQLLVVHVSEIPRGRQQERADLFIGVHIGRSRCGPQLALRLGRGLRRLRSGLRLLRLRWGCCASRGSTWRE